MSGGGPDTRRTMNRQYLRFKWSHDLLVHRLAVKLYNSTMRFVPFSIKYGIGKKLRAGSLPYLLIEDGSIVVQVGAPSDSLLAGRSRGMYFCLFAGPRGKVVIIEPDSPSVGVFKSVVVRQKIDNTVFCPTAAWSREEILQIYINDSHPASSFSEGSKDYDADRLKSFRLVEVPANTLDNLLKEQGISKVDLVSITTNGAEKEILNGMKGLIASGLPYISLAVTGEGYVSMMADLGYELLGHDDRGFTFKREDGDHA